jgi:hypothetical protein
MAKSLRKTLPMGLPELPGFAHIYVASQVNAVNRPRIGRSSKPIKDKMPSIRAVPSCASSGVRIGTAPRRPGRTIRIPRSAVLLPLSGLLLHLQPSRRSELPRPAEGVPQWPLAALGRTGSGENHTLGTLGPSAALDPSGF